MRHGHGYRKLGRESSHRKAMMRNMATSLILHGSVKTTLPKAKSLKPWVEKLITLGKKGTLHARRCAQTRLYTEQAGKKLFHQLANRFANRMGGYTRILHAGYRKGDNAKMCYLQWVDFSQEEFLERSEQKTLRLQEKMKLSKNPGEEGINS